MSYLWTLFLKDNPCNFYQNEKDAINDMITRFPNIQKNISKMYLNSNNFLTFNIKYKIYNNILRLIYIF